MKCFVLSGKISRTVTIAFVLDEANVEVGDEGGGGARSQKCHEMFCGLVGKNFKTVTVSVKFSLLIR